MSEPNPADILNLVVQCLREVSSAGKQPAGPTDSTTRLFGKDGVLDSLGLVSMIVGVEQRVREKYAISISLANDQAFSAAQSPFLTVGSLSEYVVQLLRESRG